ncbi:hypothetical protein ABG067_008020, partial [Albugo candida]
MEEFLKKNIQLPETDHKYFIDDIDVSLLFNNYQKEVYINAKRESFSFKENYRELLSLSSILLLENDSTNDNLFFNTFGQNNLQKIIRHIKDNDLAIDNNQFPFEKMYPVLTIVQQVLTKSMTREEGCLNIINIGIKVEGTHKAIVKFLRIMLEFFPLNDFCSDIIKEDDLKSRYILPMLQSLFDDWDDEENT